MSRNLSWLRPARSPLAHGFSTHTGSASTAQRTLAVAAIQMRKTVEDCTMRPWGLPLRQYSTQREPKSTGQTSRFRRTGTPSSPSAFPDTQSTGTPTAGTHVDPAAESSHGLPQGSVNKPDTQGTAAAASGTAPAPAAPARSPRLPTTAQQTPPRKPVDINSKEYKEAASKYVRFVVALPIFLVTSYFLWQRREYPRATCLAEEC